MTLVCHTAATSEVPTERRVLKISVLLVANQMFNSQRVASEITIPEHIITLPTVLSLITILALSVVDTRNAFTRTNM